MTASERAQAIAYGTRTVLQVEQEILYGKIVVAIQDAVAEEREACAQVAEVRFPRGGAHTYASENADRYLALEDAAETIAEAIRARA